MGGGFFWVIEMMVPVFLRVFHKQLPVKPDKELESFLSTQTLRPASSAGTDSQALDFGSGKPHFSTVWQVWIDPLYLSYSLKSDLMELSDF